MVLYYPNVGGGGISPDMSNYYTKGEVDSLLEQKANTDAVDSVRSDLGALTVRVEDLEGLVGGDFLVGVQTTQEGYDALTPAEKQSPHRLYFIPDDESENEGGGENG